MQISLDCYGIVVEIAGHRGWIISSNLKEVCPHCNKSDCVFSCDESQAEFRDLDAEPNLERETEQHVGRRMGFNHRMDIIESLIIAHACAGVDVTAPAYTEGIEVVVEESTKMLV